MELYNWLLYVSVSFMTSYIKHKLGNPKHSTIFILSSINSFYDKFCE